MKLQEDRELFALVDYEWARAQFRRLTRGRGGYYPHTIVVGVLLLDATPLDRWPKLLIEDPVGDPLAALNAKAARENRLQPHAVVVDREALRERLPKESKAREVFGHPPGNPFFYALAQRGGLLGFATLLREDARRPKTAKKGGR